MTASGLSWSVDALVAQRLGTDYRQNRAMCDALRKANMEWEKCHYVEDAGSSEHIKFLVQRARDARKAAQPQQQERFPNQRGNEPQWRQGRQRFLDPADVVPGEGRVDNRHFSLDGATEARVSHAHPVRRMQQYDVPNSGGVFPQKAKEDLETEPFGRSSRLRKGGWKSDPHEGNIKSRRIARESRVLDPRSRYRPAVGGEPEFGPVEVDISEGQGRTWRQAVEESQRIRVAERAERGNPRIRERGDGSCIVDVGDD